MCIRFLLHRLNESSVVLQCECAPMENLSEDGFERFEQFGDWSSSSSGHWDKNPRNSSGFGDWTSFKQGLNTATEDTADLSQEGQTFGQEHKVNMDRVNISAAVNTQTSITAVFINSTKYDTPKTYIQHII